MIGLSTVRVRVSLRASVRVRVRVGYRSKVTRQPLGRTYGKVASVWGRQGGSRRNLNPFSGLREENMRNIKCRIKIIG